MTPFAAAAPILQFNVNPSASNDVTSATAIAVPLPSTLSQRCTIALDLMTPVPRMVLASSSIPLPMHASFVPSEKPYENETPSAYVAFAVTAVAHNHKTLG